MTRRSADLYPVVRPISDDECCCPSTWNWRDYCSKKPLQDKSNSGVSRRLFCDNEEVSSVHKGYVLTRQMFHRSNVWECVHRESGHRYCVKRLPARTMSDNDDFAWREVALLQEAQGNSGIVKVIEVMDDKKHTNLIMELVTGGNLLSKVIRDDGLDETATIEIARAVLHALSHLHDKGICHNDLQPSNILIDTSGGIRLADFGCASKARSRMTKSSTSRSHAAYCAPETLRGRKSDPSVDLWSLGCVVYFCIYGTSPFVNEDETIDFEKQERAEVRFLMRQEVSRKCKQFISALVHRDPTVRLTAPEALDHPWLGDSLPLTSPICVPNEKPSHVRQISWITMSNSSCGTPPLPKKGNSFGRTSSAKSLVRKLTSRRQRNFSDPLPWKSLVDSHSTCLSTSTSSLLRE